MRNNITYGSGGGNTLTGDAVGTSRMTRQNNLWFGPGSPSCVTTEICQNPQFKNLTGNDFSLAAGSPALGKARHWERRILQLCSRERPGLTPHSLPGQR